MRSKKELLNRSYGGNCPNCVIQKAGLSTSGGSIKEKVGDIANLMACQNCRISELLEVFIDIRDILINRAWKKRR